MKLDISFRDFDVSTRYVLFFVVVKNELHFFYNNIEDRPQVMTIQLSTEGSCLAGRQVKEVLEQVLMVNPCDDGDIGKWLSENTENIQTRCCQK